MKAAGLNQPETVNAEGVNQIVMVKAEGLNPCHGITKARPGRLSDARREAG